MPEHADVAETAEASGSRRIVALFGAGVLLAALSAGLTAAGWTCVGANSVFTAAVVLMLDEHDARKTVVELAMRSIPIVVVGSIRNPARMIAVVRAGATDVVDVDLPFVDLLDAVVQGIVNGGAGTRRLLDPLAQRQRDERLLDSLTARESQVLRALAAGRSAGEIAAAERLSLPTVRSHIQAVLRKLEVSSQLAAVAIGRRGWRELGIADQRLPHQN